MKLFFSFALFLSFYHLPSEDLKEGAAERDGKRSAALAEIHTRSHTSLDPDEVFSEVEVYIEHLGEVRGYRSFPPLHKDLCPLLLRLPTPSSALVRPSSFMFPLFSSLHSEQTTSLRTRTAFIAARHHETKYGPSEMNEESGDKISKWARLYLRLIGHIQTTGLSWSFGDEAVLQFLCLDIDEKIMSFILALEMRKWSLSNKGLKMEKRALPTLAIGFIWSSWSCHICTGLEIN